MIITDENEKAKEWLRTHKLLKAAKNVSVHNGRLDFTLPDKNNMRRLECNSVDLKTGSWSFNYVWEDSYKRSEEGLKADDK